MRLNDGEGFARRKTVVKFTKSSDAAGGRTGLVSRETIVMNLLLISDILIIDTALIKMSTLSFTI